MWGDLLVELYVAADKATPKEDAIAKMYNQEIRTGLTVGDELIGLGKAFGTLEGFAFKDAPGLPLLSPTL